MESINLELAHCGSKNECAMTDTFFFPISEVSEGTVSFANALHSSSHVAPGGEIQDATFTLYKFLQAYSTQISKKLALDGVGIHAH